MTGVIASNIELKVSAMMATIAIIYLITKIPYLLQHISLHTVRQRPKMLKQKLLSINQCLVGLLKLNQSRELLQI